jgi:hypothetical protein
MEIEGIPEGWEFVRIGGPDKGEFVIDVTGEPYESDSDYRARNYVIIRKIEKPKRYRPFANAEEFKPHRDRWIVSVGSSGARRVTSYTETEVVCRFTASYEKMLKDCWYFDDDGSPFGVEVTE